MFKNISFILNATIGLPFPGVSVFARTEAKMARGFALMAQEIMNAISGYVPKKDFSEMLLETLLKNGCRIGY